LEACSDNRGLNRAPGGELLGDHPNCSVSRTLANRELHGDDSRDTVGDQGWSDATKQSGCVGGSPYGSTLASVEEYEACRSLGNGRGELADWGRCPVTIRAVEYQVPFAFYERTMANQVEQVELPCQGA
jgi:hypothetical protein